METWERVRAPFYPHLLCIEDLCKTLMLSAFSIMAEVLEGTLVDNHLTTILEGEAQPICTVLGLSHI